MTASTAAASVATITVLLVIAYAPPPDDVVPDVTVTPPSMLVVHLLVRHAGPARNLSSAACAFALSVLAMRIATLAWFVGLVVRLELNDDSADAGMATDASDPSHPLMSV